MRGPFGFVLAFLVAFVVPIACSPQVVDAVDPPFEAAGASSRGGSGGAAGGGVGATAGNGAACPDGGSEADRDGDGTLDCADGCPEDPEKQNSGLCGCGLPDTAPDGGVTCADLVSLLAHRYAFNGVGTAVRDTAPGGTAHGEVLNAELSGAGTLALEGGTTDQYALLPNRVISTRPAGDPDTGSITLEAWLRWNGGAAWQRIFDFGDNDGPQEGQQGGGGISYLFLTPKTPLEPDLVGAAPQNAKLRVAYKRPGSGEYEVTLDAPIQLPSGDPEPTHVAVVVDGTLQRMGVYINGELQNGSAYFRNVGAATFTSMTGVYDWSAPVPTADGGMVTPPAIDLTVINDINNWLGRSQFVADNELSGTYYEFRIYSAALTPELVDISYRGGPDAEFLQ
ncbi:MAG TPA: LamG-like jellyroll fold domain-containing protein [Polyangiaceae bacterium]